MIYRHWYHVCYAHYLIIDGERHLPKFDRESDTFDRESDTVVGMSVLSDCFVQMSILFKVESQNYGLSVIEVLIAYIAII